MQISKTEMMRIKAPFTCIENKSVDIDGEKYFTFKGYGSTFGNIDRDDEVMSSGCFRDWLMTGYNPPALWQHQMSEPVGVYSVCREDEKGLYVEGKLPLSDSLVSGRVVPQIKAGSVKAMSIGFTVDEYSYNKETDIVYFNKVKVWEISLVTIPANAQAIITDTKSFEQAQTITELNQLLKNCGISSRKCNIIISKMKNFVRDEQYERDVHSQLKELVEEIKKIGGILQ